MTAGFDISAGLQVGLNTVTQQLARLNRTLADNITYLQPKAFAAHGTSYLTGTILNASGFGVFDLGGPEMGERWNIKRIGVARGDDATATMTGRADWYVGPAVPILALPYPSEGHKWPFTTLPNTMFITDNGITVIAPNNLVCVISGGTASQPVWVNAEIEVIPESARTASYMPL